MLGICTNLDGLRAGYELPIWNLTYFHTLQVWMHFSIGLVSIMLARYMEVSHLCSHWSSNFFILSIIPWKLCKLENTRDLVFMLWLIFFLFLITNYLVLMCRWSCEVYTQECCRRLYYKSGRLCLYLLSDYSEWSASFINQIIFNSWQDLCAVGSEAVLLDIQTYLNYCCI